MKSTHLLPLATGCAALFCGAAFGQSSPVPVNNPSFETDVVATDGGTIPNATGWTTLTGNTFAPVVGTALTDTVATWNPTAAQITGATGLLGVGTGMSGAQALLMQTSLVGLSGSISQTTGDVLTIGQTYTLTVAVGNPADLASVGFSLNLLSGTNTLASFTATDESGIPDGTFTDETLTFVAGPAVAGLVNIPVTIVLSASPSIASNSGVAFDDVRLSVSPVPEPTSLQAMAVGLGLLLSFNFLRSRRPLFRGRGQGTGECIGSRDGTVNSL